MDADNAAARAIDVSDQKKGNGDRKRQDDRKDHCSAMHPITKQQVREDRNDKHQAPGCAWNAIPPRGLDIALGIQNIIHP